MEHSIDFTIHDDFTQEHEQVLTQYLIDDRNLTTAMRQTLFNAIELLNKSTIQLDDVVRTFRQVYDTEIDQAFANTYLGQLVDLVDVSAQSPSLTAQFAREIAPKLERSGLLVKGLSSSYFLLTYCVYWWQSFARGYAFEVEIMRDLEASDVEFEMHDILSQVERYSPADLIVLGLLGDIKTSTYFLQWQPTGQLVSDFYITRLYAKGRMKTLVVFQKPFAWQRIGGQETVSGNLSNALTLLPKPIHVKKADIELIIVEYETWKKMVKSIQSNERKEHVE